MIETTKKNLINRRVNIFDNYTIEFLLIIVNKKY